MKKMPEMRVESIRVGLRKCVYSWGSIEKKFYSCGPAAILQFVLKMVENDMIEAAPGPPEGQRRMGEKFIPGVPVRGR